MMLELTYNEFLACFPSINRDAAQQHYAICAQTLRDNGVSSRREAAMLFAQLGHESGDLNSLEENLNYSVAGLMRTFPTRPWVWKFGRTASKAADQRAIANHVYANRLGNGPPASGDGWNYRGRGIIQITGRDNYATYSKPARVDLEKNPEYAAHIHVSWRVALAYWRARGLGSRARAGDVLAVTRGINGGTNGLQDRGNRYARSCRVLGVTQKP